MAGEFAFLQTHEDTSNSSVYTHSNQNLGTADADRYIIVAAHAKKAGDPTTVSSITVAGVTATLVVQANSGANATSAALAIAAVPTGTSGDVVVTYGAQQVRSEIGMWRAVGIDSATPNDTQSDTTTSGPSVTLDVPIGFAIGAASNGYADAWGSWTGLTEDYQDPSAEGNASWGAASDTFASADASHTVTPDIDPDFYPTLVAASWAWATGAGTITPGLGQQLTQAFSPTITTGPVYVTPGLVQQLAQAFDPTITTGALSITPGLAQSLTQTFDPTITTGPVSITPGLVQQLTTPFAPTVTTGPVHITPSLVQQLAVAFNPTVLVGPSPVTPALIQQLVTAFNPTISGSPGPVTPSLIQQLIVAFAPTLLGGTAPVTGNRMGGTGAIRRRGGVPR